MRVKMEMLMGVDVIEGEAGGGKSSELGIDLCAQFLARPSRERHLNAEHTKVAPQKSIGVDEV